MDDPTPIDISALQAAYQSRRRKVVGVSIGIAALLLTCLVCSSRDWTPWGLPRTAWLAAILPLMLAGQIASTVWWRCPACSKTLGKSWNPLQCERCGFTLRKEGLDLRTAAATKPERELLDVRQKFAKLRRRQWVATIPFLVVLVPLLLGQFGVALPPMLGDRNKQANVLLAIGAATFAFSLWNWRCPGCNAYLGKTRDARHCRRCGVQLRD